MKVYSLNFFKFATLGGGKLELVISLINFFVSGPETLINATPEISKPDDNA